MVHTFQSVLYPPSDPTEVTEKYDFSTRAGFQRAMENALSTPLLAELKAFAGSVVVPSFHQVISGKRFIYGEYYKSLEAWRGKVIDCNTTV
jgi:hypothetical protein